MGSRVNLNTAATRIGPAEWIIFMDTPRHSRLRGLISQAFTPRSIANLEPRIHELSGELLDSVVPRGEMDLATDFAIPLPMMVISEMLGGPVADRARFRHWNDVLLDMSYTVPGNDKAPGAMNDFIAATAEMNDYLTAHQQQRDHLLHRTPRSARASANLARTAARRHRRSPALSFAVAMDAARRAP